MNIESCQFGEIVVGGKRYVSDVLVFPASVQANWWRKEGHELHPADLEEVIKEKPEILVVGTGWYGMMKVLPEARYYLEGESIELVAQPTEEACHTYNQLSSSRRVAAALHLTC